MRAARRSWWPWLGGFAVLAVVASCQDYHVQLPVQGGPAADDDDDDDDETPTLCDANGMCPGSKETLCHPLGYCVECLNSDDCAPGYVCDLEGECERARN